MTQHITSFVESIAWLAKPRKSHRGFLCRGQFPCQSSPALKAKVWLLWLLHNLDGESIKYHSPGFGLALLLLLRTVESSTLLLESPFFRSRGRSARALAGRLPIHPIAWHTSTRLFLTRPLARGSVHGEPGGSSHPTAGSGSAASAVFKCRFAEGDSDVEMHYAPIKTFARMLEKVLAAAVCIQQYDT